MIVKGAQGHYVCRHILTFGNLLLIFEYTLMKVVEPNFHIGDLSNMVPY